MNKMNIAMNTKVFAQRYVFFTTKNGFDMY